MTLSGRGHLGPPESMPFRLPRNSAEVASPTYWSLEHARRLRRHVRPAYEEQRRRIVAVLRAEGWYTNRQNLRNRNRALDANERIPQLFRIPWLDEIGRGDPPEHHKMGFYRRHPLGFRLPYK